MTILFRDPFFQQHETGFHPEMPKRLQAIDAQLDSTDLPAKCLTGKYSPIAEEALLSLHSSRQIETVKQLAARGGGSIDADTLVSPKTFEVALAAAGACVAAVDQVMQSKDKNALCLVRPPGHHATPVRSMGFCMFNNIALTAHHARQAHGLQRILIVDWDVHHGNGTQDIFYEDGEVTFFSIHRYGFGFYPGTGAASETGSGPGLGYTFNEPIAYGTSLAEYHSRFERTLQKATEKSKPQLVLISAGFDAHRHDPIGSLGLETQDFARLTQKVIGIAETYAQGRVISCLEGGYNLQALADSVQAHLEELSAASASQ